MNTKPVRAFTKTAALLFAALALCAGAVGEPVAPKGDHPKWFDHKHKPITEDEVVHFLTEHRNDVAKKRKIHSSRKDGRDDYLPDIAGYEQRLKGANLTGINLTDVVARTAPIGVWAEKERRTLEFLDLTGCMLDGATLSGLEMTGVILTDASLIGANLQGLKLTHAFLTLATLGGTTAPGKPLTDVERAAGVTRAADVSGAHFSDVEAVSAYWKNANLSTVHFTDKSKLDDGGFEEVKATEMELTNSTALGASFTKADLTQAKLIASDVDKADFEGATLKEVTWEVRGEPDIPSLLYSLNLETLKYDSSPTALVRLRKVLMEGGVTKQERDVNLALQRARTEHDWGNGWPSRMKAGCRTIFFDWTTEYGRQPGRALELIGLLLLLFAIPYTWILIQPERKGKLTGFSDKPQGAADQPGRAGHKGTHATDKPAVAGDSEALAAGKRADGSVTRIRYAHYGKPHMGIWAVPLEKRVQGGPVEPVRLHVDLRGRGKWKGLWRALRIGMLFSVISAFSMGFRELDVGRWIERIKHDESTLQGTGWVRTLSGMQSLLSFFLLALWLLTYFGRPFE